MRVRAGCLPLAAGALIASASPAAPAGEAVRCMFDDAAPVACRFSDVVAEDGRHRMTFAAPGRRTLFVGRSQSGWWSGTLDGKPAMGYERNRGNVVFSTLDGTRRFAWWYPAAEHGSY